MIFFFFSFFNACDFLYLNCFFFFYTIKINKERIRGIRVSLRSVFCFLGGGKLLFLCRALLFFFCSSFVFFLVMY